MARRAARGKEPEEEAADESVAPAASETAPEEVQERFERWTEEYSEILEQLPLELQRSFKLMRELERPRWDEIRALWEQYCAGRAGSSQAEAPETSSEGEERIKEESLDTHSAPSTTGISGKEQLRAMRRAADASIDDAEERLALATSLYDVVDRHIRRLDADLQKNEDSLYNGLRQEIEAEQTAGGGRHSKAPRISDRLAPEGQLLSFWSSLVAMDPRVCLEYLKEYLVLPSDASQAAALQASLKKKPGRKPKRPTANDSEADAEAMRAAALDVDPSEPRYCYCNGVSYGEMVACENDDCPREWFHYGCVGLTQPPKGKWYCQFCAPPNWKGPGTQVPANAVARPEKRMRHQ